MKTLVQFTSISMFFAAFSMDSLAENWTKIAGGSPQMEVGEALDQTPIDLSKPSLINFWATWCPPCIAEIPDLAIAAQALDPSVQFVLVNVGESRETIEVFFADAPDRDPRADTIVTSGFEFGDLSKWKIRGLPTTFLVNGNQVLYQSEGVLHWADPEIQSEISSLLGLQTP